MDVNAYLERIGAHRPDRPDAEALRDLHERHLRSVPFENLSIHLGEPIDLAESALAEKIIQRRRGGFCYELNGLFAVLLRELGFEVSLLSAKVARPDGSLGPPFDHMALRVELDEPWLADVGFGKHSLRPLRLTAAEPQPDPYGEFLVVDTPEGDLEVRRDGVVAYVAERRQRALSDFAPTAWWQATSPVSPFRKGTTCSMPSGDGRVTIAGGLLIETGADGDRAETALETDDAILAAYRERFGMTLEHVPDLLTRTREPSTVGTGQ
ncbi:acetyltransferase [Amycolatopsis antarctica]|uniref:Acetyltransferase n=1 Tax=Amycolatopsis antarctica TaxID=1854586 RepID=A0A263CZ31_9PSEU|nr:arylamine N-acetyltransferase [Amycolatopsis antarctica]OZM70566.1 acetyltransferase [Amycolatopsis antarctica]